MNTSTAALSTVPTVSTVSLTGMSPSHNIVRLPLARSRRAAPQPALEVTRRSGPARTPKRVQVAARPATPERLETTSFPLPSASGEGAFVMYLREIGRVPLLTAEQERDLARRVRQGDRDARDHMIQANLRLVVRIARDFESFGLPLLDLISEGNIGLMTAVDRFDPSRGVRLCTYAALWIKQHMRRAIANFSRTIRVPVHVCERLGQINRAAAKLEKILGRTPTLEELAHETGEPIDKVRSLRQAILPTLSLENVTRPDGTGLSVAETVADERALLASDQLDENDVHGALGDALGLLNTREQEILRRRFGLDGDEPQTLDDVGFSFRLTRERIRQLQEGALRKLRMRLRKKLERGI